MASARPASACCSAWSCSCSARACSTAPARSRSASPAQRPVNEYLLYAIGLAAVGICWFLIQYTDVIQTLLIVAGVGLLGYVLWQATKLEKAPRERIYAILFLISLNPIFWALFEQAGGSMNLFTDRFVDRAGRSGVDLPGDQPDLHHPAGAAVRRAVDQARPRRARSRRRRPSSASPCCRWAWPTSLWCGARRRSAWRR